MLISLKRKRKERPTTTELKMFQTLTMHNIIIRLFLIYFLINYGIICAKLSLKVLCFYFISVVYQYFSLLSKNDYPKTKFTKKFHLKMLVTQRQNSTH